MEVPGEHIHRCTRRQPGNERHLVWRIESCFSRHVPPPTKRNGLRSQLTDGAGNAKPTGMPEACPVFLRRNDRSLGSGRTVSRLGIAASDPKLPLVDATPLPVLSENWYRLLRSRGLGHGRVLRGVE